MDAQQAAETEPEADNTTTELGAAAPAEVAASKSSTPGSLCLSSLSSTHIATFSHSRFSSLCFLPFPGLLMLPRFPIHSRTDKKSDEPKKAPGKRAAKKGAVEPVATKKAKA